MSFVVIVRGCPGSGKTTAAMETAKVIKGHYISFDALLGEDGIGNPYIVHPSDTGRILNLKALERARPHLEKGTPVVCDWLFDKQAQLDDLKKQLKDFPCHDFLLVTPSPIALKRNAARQHVQHKETVVRLRYNCEQVRGGHRIYTERLTAEAVLGEIIHRIQHPEYGRQMLLDGSLADNQINQPALDEDDLLGISPV